MERAYNTTHTLPGTTKAPLIPHIDVTLMHAEM
jgi:hypothetical protein